MILLKVPIFILAMQEIVVMTAKRPSILPTIQEDRNEATYSIVRGVIISPSSMYWHEFQASGSPFWFLSRRSRQRLWKCDVPPVYQKRYWCSLCFKESEDELGFCHSRTINSGGPTEKNVPFVPHLRWAFQDGEQSYWVIVSCAVHFLLSRCLVHTFSAIMREAAFLNMFGGMDGSLDSVSDSVLCFRNSTFFSCSIFRFFLDWIWAIDCRPLQFA